MPLIPATAYNSRKHIQAQNNMKKILPIFIYLILGALASFFLPWWAIAPFFAAIAFFTRTSPSESFLIGTLAGVTLWASYASILGAADGMKLSGMVGNIFQGLSPMQLVILAGVIGGLVGGMGALTGSYFRSIFTKDVVNTD